MWCSLTVPMCFLLQKTQPGSVAVLLRLPSSRLKDVLSTSEALRPAMLAYYKAQHKSIPAALEPILNPKSSE
jgi:hypothetical protein